MVWTLVVYSRDRTQDAQNTGGTRHTKSSEKAKRLAIMQTQGRAGVLEANSENPSI